MMAAAMTGATLGINASPFSGPVGGPPKTGQFFMAIDPTATSGGDYSARMAALVEAMADQDGARIPGNGRRAKRDLAKENGVAVNAATLDRIETFL
jgi:(2R)-3-sulfolactate dehydrogenase (NADP+)